MLPPRHSPRDPVQTGQGRRALQRLREIMGKLKLTVNEEKTRICSVPEGAFALPGIQRPFCARARCPPSKSSRNG